MAQSAGAGPMEGVLGALPWSWQVPYKFNFEKGKKYVEAYSKRYNSYPSTSGASAYTILHEYKAAVERAGSFESADVIMELEGHAYTSLKDKQIWRGFDHQSTQTVYAVKGKPAAEVNKDKFKQDFFEIISSIPRNRAAITESEWIENRKKAGLAPNLEALPGE
jgi:hypothetical protein